MWQQPFYNTNSASQFGATSVAPILSANALGGNLYTRTMFGCSPVTETCSTPLNTSNGYNNKSSSIICTNRTDNNNTTTYGNDTTSSSIGSNNSEIFDDSALASSSSFLLSDSAGAGTKEKENHKNVFSEHQKLRTASVPSTATPYQQNPFYAHVASSSTHQNTQPNNLADIVASFGTAAGTFPMVASTAGATGIEANPFSNPSASMLISQSTTAAMALMNGGVSVEAIGKPPAKKRPRPTPESEKNDKYREKRRKNNDSAKRSRAIRKNKEEINTAKITFLEQENAKLRYENQCLKTQFHMLMEASYAFGTGMQYPPIALNKNGY